MSIWGTKRTTVTVARVVDGDTIITEDGERIRLVGIDTPEKGEPGYDHAKQRLKELVLGKEVSLESDRDDQDKYGRSLRYIHYNNKNINLQLVKEGYATTLFYRNKKYKKELLKAKKEAEKNEIGPLWNETIRATLPLTYDTAQWRDPTATIEQKEAAWIAAGEPFNFRTKTIQTSPTMEILALTKEEYQAAQGFKPTPSQLDYILIGDKSSAFLIGKEIPESREARYKELVDEWKAFEAGKARLEHPTKEQEMESWRRAGLAPGQKYTQKIYRDELGKLLGVGTYTPEELEEMGGFTPSETQAEWAFRSTRKMTPIKQFKVWAEEYKTQQEQEHKTQEELTRIAIGAPIKRQKHDPIPLELTMTTRRARRKELEEMLGEGVDR